MSLEIKHCTIHDIETCPHFDILLKEYAEESAIKGLPHPLAKLDTYRMLEANGAMSPIGAFVDGVLIGFILMLAPVMPHYSVRIAICESFFVMKEQRKTGAGLKLLKAAESYTKDAGGVGMLISAPIGGSLAKVLPKVGYEETNRVFFRSLSDE